MRPRVLACGRRANLRTRSPQAAHASTFGSAVSGFCLQRSIARANDLEAMMGESVAFQARRLQSQGSDLDPMQAAELHSCGERVNPIQPRESREIPICRAQRKPMLDGERRQMRIRHEITVHAWQRQKLAKHFGVTL